MKIENMSGEFAFKGMVKLDGRWIITGYYFSLDELKTDPTYSRSNEVKWPVEVLDNGGVYIPDESEYK